MMGLISVEFRAKLAGLCDFCRKEKDDVFDVAFSDKSFEGRLCKNDLLRAIGMKVDAHPRASGSMPATNGVPVGST
jgi:hypothetical protein